MTSAHVLKLADRIHALVAQLLERRVKDPRLGFVTITGVELTGDTRDATVFYTVMGDAAAHAGTAAALASATGMLRSEVGKQMGLRHTPSLTFVPDVVPESAAAIEDALQRARETDAAVAERAAGAQYAGEADPYRKDRDDEESEH